MFVWFQEIYIDISLFPAFKGKQPRKNSLLHLDEISKLVDEKNATEFKDFIFFPGK